MRNRMNLRSMLAKRTKRQTSDTPSAMFALESRVLLSTVYWVPNVNGTFSNGANWVGGVPPGAGDKVVFDSTVTVDLSADTPALGEVLIDGGVVVDIDLFEVLEQRGTGIPGKVR